VNDSTAPSDRLNDQGMGVHTPELDFERDLELLRREVGSLGIKYCVVTDQETEEVIKKLLAEEPRDLRTSENLRATFSRDWGSALRCDSYRSHIARLTMRLDRHLASAGCQSIG
jgi:hypothetical protein